MAGKSGSDSVTGTNASEHLNGGASGDTINGMAGDDRINGGSGNDILDGGSGSDIVRGDAHNDTLVYVVSQNVGSRDVYDGGSDVDTLRLVMTRAEWLNPTFQSDLARYLTFVQTNTLPNGQAKNVAFEFTAFGLSAARFEKIELFVDGVLVDPADQAVALNNDTMLATEDSASASVDVLANDSVPDLISTFSHSQPAHGTVALTYAAGAPGSADSARFVYTPNPTAWQYLAVGETGIDSFTYTVRDADGDVSTATVTVTIIGANDAPKVLAINAGVTHEDAVPLSINLLATATDVDASDDLDVAGVTAASSNTDRTLVFTVDAETGAFVLNPSQFNDLAVGESETVTVSFTVTDGNGGNVTNIATIVVEGRNDAPVVSAISVAASDEDAPPVVIDLLSTASDVDATDDLDVASVSATSSNAARTLTFTVDAETGAFNLDPAQFNDLAVGESETVTVTYNVVDRNGGGVANTATFVIAGRNDAPVITVIDAGATDEDAVPFAVDLLATASDVDLTDDLDVADVTAASSNGARILAFTVDAETGAFSLNPSQFNDLAVGESETVTVSYNVVDGNGGVVANWASFIVEGRNDAPVVVAINAGATNEDAAPFAIALLATASDADLTDELGVADVSAVSTNAARALTFSVDAETGAFSLDPSQFNDLAVGESETVTVSFNVVDGNGGVTANTATLIIEGRNDAPVIGIADASGAVVESDAAELVDAGSIAFGDVDLSDEHLITVTASADGYLGNLIASVPDASTGDGQGRIDWSFVVASAAVQFLAEGQVLTQSYTISIDDGHGSLDSQVVEINIIGTNDGPVAVADTATAAENGPAVTGNVLDNDTDVDGGAVLTVSQLNGQAVNVGVETTLASGAKVTLNADGTYSYNPNSRFEALAVGQSAIDSFTYQVSDQHGASSSQTVTLTITGSNDGPVAVADSRSVAENGPAVGGNVLSNDSDIDNGAVLTVSQVNGSAASVGAQIALASGALLTLNANGTYSYNPNGRFESLAVGQTATDSFTYQVSDQFGASASQTVTLTITGSNDGPVAVADVNAALENGPAVTGNVLANDSDVDAGAVLSVSQVNGSAGNVGAQVTLASGALVTLSANGNYSYNPNGRFETLALGQTTTDSFTYQVRDAQGAVATQTVTVTLTGSNDAPVVSDVTLGTGVSAGLPLVFGGWSSSFGQAVFALVDNNNDGRVETASSISNLTATGYGNAYGLATGDLDGDGDVDVAVAANGGLFVFTNRGDTNSDGIVEFTGTQIRSGFSGYDVALADLNGDGRLDLTSATNGQLIEILNLGDTNANGVIDNFSTRTLSSTAFSVYGITATDLNNDGRTDILIAGWSAGPVEIRFNLGDTNGDGQIDYRTQIIEDAYDESGIGVDAGDIDGDGDTDFILSRYNSQDEVVYLNLGDNNGDGLLEFANIVLPTGGNTLESEMIDIDKDGDLDVVSNAAQGAPRISYNLGDTNNDGRPEFAVQNLTGPNSNLGLAVGDVDGDGDLDIVLPSLSAGQAMVLLNNGDTNGDGRLDFTSVTLNGANTSWDAEFVSVGTGGAGGAREDGPAVTGAFKGDDINSDDNAASLTYAITSAPAEGTVVNNNNGTFSFVPGSAFQDLGVGETRTVSFTYTATDAHGAVSNTSTVTIKVAGTNDAPVAAVDAVTTNEDAPVTFNVRANDSDIDGDALHVSHINGTAIAVNATVSLGTGNGSVRLNADGTLTYTPTANANGARSFTYTVSDGVGGSATATVNLTINPVNDVPLAVADFASTNEDTAITLLGSTLRANDVDIDGAGTFAITSVSATSAKGATVTLTAGGDVVYNPAASSTLQALTRGQQTTDTFTYTITDAAGVTSTATVTITVAGQLEAPTANPDTVTVVEGGTVSGNAVTNDVVTGSTGGSGNVLINGSFEQGNPVGPGGIAYPASLPGWTSAQGSFEVWGTGFGGNIASDGIAFLELDNGGGIDAYSSTLTTQAGRQYTLQFDLAIRNGTAAASNRVEFFVNGVSLGIFTPAATTFSTYAVTFVGSGSDVIMFKEPTSDGVGGLIDNLRIAAQADVFVTAVDGAAGGVGQPVAGSTGGTFTVLSNGNYTFNAGTAFEYLAAGETAVSSVTYTVTDDGGSSTSTISVTITGVNDGPVAIADSRTVSEDAAGSGNVLANDSDVDASDLLTVSQVNGQAAGVGVAVTLTSGAQVTLNADGSYSYNPLSAFEALAVGQSATDSFSYTVSDGHGGTAGQTVTLTITGANDGPTITGAVANGAVAEDGASTTQGTVSFGDVDLTDAHSVSAAPQSGGYLGTFSASLADPATGDGAGQVAWTFAVDNTAIQHLKAGQTLTQVYAVTIDDGQGGSVQQNVTVTIAGANDAPKAVNDSATTNEDTAVTFNLLSNDSDIDGAALAISQINGVNVGVGSQVTLAGGGVLTIGAGGSVTFTPVANASDDKAFTYTVSDGAGGTATGNAGINVKAVADTPTLAVGSSTVLNPTVGSAIKTTMTLQAGDTITIDWDFVAHDYMPYNDFAFATVNGAAFMLGSVQVVGDYGTTGWKTFTFTAPADGSYTFGMSAFNVNDTGLNSHLLVDNMKKNGVVVQSFETGNFNGWTTLGTVAVVTGHDGLVPTNGGQMAYLDSAPQTQADVEVFLGLPVNRLDDIAKSSGLENQGITVPVSMTVAPGETIANAFVVLTGYPAGSVFNFGAFDAALGGWKVAASDLGGSLQVTTPRGFSGAFTLSVKATSFEPETGTSATTAAQTTQVIVSGATFDQVGTAGDDALVGGSLADQLNGGAGNDMLKGNGGADSFVFQQNALGFSDQILDFASGIDKINVSGIDANAGLVGDQGFTWVEALSGVAGQVVQTINANGSATVLFDVNGDGVADLTINLNTASVVSDWLL